MAFELSRVATQITSCVLIVLINGCSLLFLVFE